MPVALSRRNRSLKAAMITDIFNRTTAETAFNKIELTSINAAGDYKTVRRRASRLMR
jgi:hypothetical protein